MAAAGLAALCVAAGVAAGRQAPDDFRVPRGLLEAVVVGIPMLAGAYALRSPPNRRFGHLLIAAGAAWALWVLGGASASVPAGVARLAGWIVLPILVYLMLAFPHVRLDTLGDRRLFGLFLAVVACLYAGSAPFSEAFPAPIPPGACTPDCPPNALMVLDTEPAVVGSLIQPVREVLTVLLLLGVVGSLVDRRHAASPFSRRALRPVRAMGIVCAGVLAAYIGVREAAGGGALADSLGHVWSITLPGLAAAVVAGIAGQRMMIGDTLARLYRDQQRPDVASMRATLTGQLGDETIDLLLPEHGANAWRTMDGLVLTSADVQRQGRGLTVIRDERRRAIAAIAHDRAVEGEQLLDGVSGAVRTALQQKRTETLLAHALLQLEESRARIAREADIERSRIERDLHDGAQQRLIALRMQLSMAMERTHDGPGELSVSLDSLGGQVDAALEEIRALAHGVYPPILTDRGLEDALRSAAASAPRRVAFVTGVLGRYPPEIETAVYFTCSEALQNACKYAPHARRLRVALWHEGGLSFEIRDDGPGFEVPQVPTGGLRNMQDRIAAVGGMLTIESTPGGGTRVTGFVPVPDPGPTRRPPLHRGAVGAIDGDD